MPINYLINFNPPTPQYYNFQLKLVNQSMCLQLMLNIMTYLCTVIVN